MEDKEFTIDELIDFLTKLKASNCGDYKVIIGERPLYTDEYIVAPQEKELIFKGCLYHEDITERAIQLQVEIKKSIEKFYRK
jgi:hypothetical protein